jgi:putative transcriptional regulator
MVLPNKARAHRRRRPIELEDRLPQRGSRAKGSRVGDDLVAAFEEMAKHLRGEIELQACDLPTGAMPPAQIKLVRLKVASSTKDFERRFGIPARTMESYEQGRRKLDGAMRALLRIIDREPAAVLRAFKSEMAPMSQSRPPKDSKRMMTR